MCGILGVAVGRGFRPGLDAGGVARVRDMMSHRGPDDAGVWDGGHVILGHRRLAVVDLSTSGRQPMATPDGRHVISYNGELYNDAALRRDLSGEGVRFMSSCDAETVLWALATWGGDGLRRLRGMFAIAWFDVSRMRLTLARDPLGIKPLYWWIGEGGGQREAVFASEIAPILAHPAVRTEPDFVTISAYLTTIRTTLGERTMFAGVRSLRPGEVVELDLSNGDGSIGVHRRTVGHDGLGLGGAQAGEGFDRTGMDGARAASRVRDCVEESITAHLRSDASVCCLLSGGLDSSIIATVAHGRLGGLRTFWAGAAEGGGDDRAFARLMASRLDSEHEEVVITRDVFMRRWRGMVGQMRTPLSTPNEVAIREVCQRMCERGQVVALSGEGADELFGGYEGPLRQAMEFETVLASERIDDGEQSRRRARFQLDSNAWMSLGIKPVVLRPEHWRGVEGDALLVSEYESGFAEVAGVRDDDSPLQAHLRFHRRINLAGLLLRLDSSSMGASVEGRTPLADVAVCALAESLAMDDKFRADEGGGWRTKIALREAYAGELPSEVVSRPKASFPLPFQTWMMGEDVGAWLRESRFAREVFADAAIDEVSQRPDELWNLAWPMVNVAVWGESVWGDE